MGTGGGGVSGGVQGGGEGQMGERGAVPRGQNGLQEVDEVA